eukprot:UC4_evm2s186
MPGLVNFRGKMLVNAGRRLAPGVLRVGGSAADLLWIDFGEEIPWSEDHMITKNNFTIPAQMFWDIVAFAKATGLRLLFDLNVLGARHHNNSWDCTNAEQLFRQMNKTQTDYSWFEGFQFGNEVSDRIVSGSQYAKDYDRVLALLEANLSELFSDRGKKILQVPDTCCYPTDSIFLTEFLSSTKKHIDSLSFHHYSNQFPGSWSCNTSLNNGILSPRKASLAASVYQAYNAIIDLSRKNTTLVLSEMAGHSTGGCENVTDTFVSTLWFVDALGVQSRYVDQVYRQKLIGTDKYDLITFPSRHNPDFYTTILWKTLMGPVVLDTESSLATLRVHGSCAIYATKGAVALVLANFDKTDVTITASTPLFDGKQLRYLLQSPALFSHTVTLNGNILTENSRLDPDPHDGTDNLTVPAYAALFLCGANSDTVSWNTMFMLRCEFFNNTISGYGDGTASVQYAT